jgi:hypothetical protein
MVVCGWLAGAKLWWFVIVFGSPGSSHAGLQRHAGQATRFCAASTELGTQGFRFAQGRALFASAIPCKRGLRTPVSQFQGPLRGGMATRCSAVADALPLNGNALPLNGKRLPFNGNALPLNGKRLPLNGNALPLNGNAIQRDGNAMQRDGNAMQQDCVRGTVPRPDDVCTRDP